MSDFVTISVSGIVKETERAWLFRLHNSSEVWLPKGLGKWKPDQGEVSMPDWLAEEKGLDYE